MRTFVGKKLLPRYRDWRQKTGRFLCRRGPSGVRVSEVDFQQSEAPDWVQKGQEDQKATWFFAAANGRYFSCGKRFWNRCKNNKKPQRTCGNVTIQNFKECTGTSKRQTEEGRLNRMCVQSSLCQLWQDLHRRNWKDVWTQITGTQNWNGIQNRTHIH